MTLRAWLSLVCCASALCVACETDPPPPPPPAVTFTASSGAPMDPDRWPGMYAAKRVYEVGRPRVEEISDADALIAPRKLGVAIYEPAGAPVPSPVVLLSHGGSEGRTDPTHALDRWAYRIAKAGFVVVAVAHGPRTATERDAMCAHFHVKDCAGFDPLHWDRPHDIGAVLDAIASVPSVDSQKVAYLGHSAGAGSVMTVAGAKRRYDAEPVTLADTRVTAFIALSPQGPGMHGFEDGSWAPIVRPMLVATGVADTTAGEEAADRRKAFDGLPAGDKFLLFMNHKAADHDTFAGELAGCQAHAKGTGETCQQLLRVIHSAILAFLDAYLRDDRDAAAWLRSSKLEAASRGRALWYVKDRPPEAATQPPGATESQAESKAEGKAETK